MKGEFIKIETARINADMEKENKDLQEQVEYLNYCNDELRKTITNLKYKIKKLEEDLEGKDE